MVFDARSIEFHLHFEGEGTRGHIVPGSILAQAVQALQRSIHLLGMAREGRDFRERLRVSPELERKYAVVFRLPEAGGYDIPYLIGNTAEKLFDVDDVIAVVTQHEATLDAVQRNDPVALRRAIPTESVRKQVVLALKNMQPRSSTGLVVSIENYRRQKLLDGFTAGARIAPMLNEQSVPRIHPVVVTGRLDALDFQGRSLKLHLPSGRRLDCSYSEDFEPILLENPREFIQVRGEAVLDENDNLEALQNITEIVEVDLSPVLVTAITVDGLSRAATSSISFPVDFDREGNLYTATGDFNMLATGETRPEVEANVARSLSFLWKEYVPVSPDTFSEDARALRENLIRSFGGAEDAA